MNFSNPLEALRYHTSGAVERGECVAIESIDHDDLNNMLERAWNRRYITGEQMCRLYDIVRAEPDRMAAYCAKVREARAEHDIPAHHWPLVSAGGACAWGAPINPDNVRCIIRSAFRCVD